MSLLLLLLLLLSLLTLSLLTLSELTLSEPLSGSNPLGVGSNTHVIGT